MIRAQIEKQANSKWADFILGVGEFERASKGVAYEFDFSGEVLSSKPLCLSGAE